MGLHTFSKWCISSPVSAVIYKTNIGVSSKNTQSTKSACHTYHWLINGYIAVLFVCLVTQQMNCAYTNFEEIVPKAGLEIVNKVKH